MIKLLFVAGTCEREDCRQPFVLTSVAGVPNPGANYCSTTCRSRMKKRRRRMSRADARLSCTGCEVATPTRVPICPACKAALAAMCGGKRRTTRTQAEHSARAWGMDAYLCEVCSEWHAGKSGDWTRSHARNVRAIVDRLRAGDDGWVLRELAYEWHPRRVRRDQIKETVLS
jgi:hypothetical protein